MAKWRLRRSQWRGPVVPRVSGPYGSRANGPREPGLEIRGGGSRPPHTPPPFLSAAPAASPKIHGKSMGSHGSPWDPMGSHGVPMASMENPRMSEIVDFNENHNSVRQKIGVPGSKSMRNIFPLHPVTSKRPESPYGAKYFFLAENTVFQFFGP